MQRYPAMIVASLGLALGCMCVHAEDFMPRASTGFAAGGESAASCPPRAASAMSEATSTQKSKPAADVDGEVATDTSTQPNHVAADATSSASSTSAGTTSVAHKARGGMRWQSLLPGVMK